MSRVWLSRCLIGAMYAAWVVASATAQTPGKAKPKLGMQPRMPDNVLVDRDVEYGRAGDRPLLLHVLRPKDRGEKPLPVVVFIHGGAWRAGSRDAGIPQLAPFVATGNYLGVSVGYRLTDEAIWPAQIHDCKAAIRWIRANAAKYNLDPEKIGVWGSSAGGHLVSLLGTSGGVKELEGANGSPGQSSRVTCVVDFCGPSDFLEFAKFKRTAMPPTASPQSPESLLLGGPVLEKQDLARQASPVTYASADDPPFLIMHGTDDPLVPYNQAELLYAALKKAGAKPLLVRIQGGGHGFGGPEVSQRVRAFFDKHLRGQDVTVSESPIDASKPAPRKGADAKGRAKDTRTR
ncbi:MAG: alpha/beta hydrolase [Thermoguttaceae bacterium]|nr:alpha/beta hydrolase [Thermoguttaceae bacterium]